MKGYPISAGAPADSIFLEQYREVYTREANISPDWKRCRVGMFYSLCGLTEDSVPAAAETITRTNVLDQLMFGIGNGVEAYGEAGNRFLGVVSPPSGYFRSLYVGGTSQYWQMTDSIYYVAVGNGLVTKTLAINNASPTYARHKADDPSRFAAYLGIDVTLSGTTALIQVAGGTSVAPYGFSNTSKINLIAFMNDPAGAGISYYNITTIAGGWWNGAPVDLRHVMVRIPHNLARLRIHAMDVMQLA